MKKIPCLFQRDFTDRRRPALLNCVTPGCEWVLDGEGIATRKWDGTACMVKGGRLYARLDCKRGKAPPVDAIPCDPEADPVTGHWPHWVPVTDDPKWRWHSEAFGDSGFQDGTYELIGPKINGNSEHEKTHLLVRHGAEVFDVPRDWDGLRAWLDGHSMEGLVFHNPDGRMAKIRRDDYGMAWPVVGSEG